MSPSNDWDVYTLDDSDDRVVEEYFMDYEIEDDWPEYEIPEDDIVLNKEALLAIKLAQPLNSERSVDKQQQLLEEQYVEFLKEVESAEENIRLNETALEEGKDKIDAMHQENKGSYNHERVILPSTTVDDEELLLSPQEMSIVKSQQTIGQSIPDDTMTIFLIACIIIWLLFQFKVNHLLFMLYCFYIYLSIILHRTGGKEVLLVLMNNSR